MFHHSHVLLTLVEGGFNDRCSSRRYSILRLVWLHAAALKLGLDIAFSGDECWDLDRHEVAHIDFDVSSDVIHANKVHLWVSETEVVVILEPESLLLLAEQLCKSLLAKTKIIVAKSRVRGNSVVISLSCHDHL